MAFITPTELWRLALNPANLFQERGLDAGALTEPARAAGTGLGTVELTAESNPRDAWSVRVDFPVAGECNVSGRLNLAGLPSCRISLDGGTTWSRRLRPDDNGLVPFQAGGFTLRLRNGAEGSAVNFGSGDAQLQVRAKHYGLTFRVATGSTLTHSYDAETGACVLTVTGSTTAAQAATYLASSGLLVRATYGGTGAGAVQAAAAQALPYQSFVTSDVWTFSTQPSPDVVLAIDAGHDELLSYLRSSLQEPLSAPGAMLKQCEADLARWSLLVRKGLHKDHPGLEPKTALAYLQECQGGGIVPTVTETPPAKSFATLVPDLDPLSMEAGSFPI